MNVELKPAAVEENTKIGVTRVNKEVRGKGPVIGGSNAA